MVKEQAFHHVSRLSRFVTKPFVFVVQCMIVNSAVLRVTDLAACMAFLLEQDVYASTVSPVPQSPPDCPYKPHPL